MLAGRRRRLKFSQMKLERLQKRSERTSTAASVPKRSSRTISDPPKDICFFCDRRAGSEVFHNASTFNTDTKVWRCALELEDTKLLELAPGDMIAPYAKYHRKFLMNLYNRARALHNVDAQNDSDNDGQYFQISEDIHRGKSIVLHVTMMLGVL